MTAEAGVTVGPRAGDGARLEAPVSKRAEEERVTRWGTRWGPKSALWAWGHGSSADSGRKEGARLDGAQEQTQGRLGA